MADLKEAELAEMISHLPSVDFENEHGESFRIHSNGIRTFMSGSEVDMMVDPELKIMGKYIELFNESFNIWNVFELEKLGESLVKLAGKIDKEKA